jgi:hypothetical protein
MIEGLPNWINVVFLLTVGVCIAAFYYANGKIRNVLLMLIVWTVIQSILALTGFYQNTSAFPPRFILVLLPTSIFMVAGLLPKYRDELLKKRNRSLSTFLHTVRIPVEIILLYLFIHKMIPELMTFEGRNFDILAGLTAPMIGILILMKRAGNTLLIVWNLISLGLVSFIVTNGILSAELPIQQFGFDQPNKAVLYFPFILLPAVIVPIVLYTHITDIIILLKERKAVYKVMPH